jgi:predicted small integral membrane protein
LGSYASNYLKVLLPSFIFSSFYWIGKKGVIQTRKKVAKTFKKKTTKHYAAEKEIKIKN